MSHPNPLKLLFIGNSHTYVNDLPALVRELAREDGCEAQVVMIAHGGWYLFQHVKEPDVRFNIRFGGYDYVILQEHSHPFDRIEDYKEAAETLAGWAREAGARPVIYGTCAMEAQEPEQERMNRVNRELAEELGAVLAPVGESWWDYKRSHPELKLYAEDGAHASLSGSEYAAKVIWGAIKEAIGR